jgi:CDP-diacylglycerol pyrophosphatase
MKAPRAITERRARSIHRLRRGACVILALGVFAAQASGLHAEDRDALWKQIHDVCLPKAEQSVYPPTPCIDVHTGDDGYVLFKDRHGRYQYLLLPLARIPGIESPLLLKPGAPNYLARAWDARLYVEAALGVAQPRDVISLVVNSPTGRSQDQLHVHIDCVRREVREAIDRMLPAMTARWAWLPAALPPDGRRYLARWVSGVDLDIDPFKDLARTLAPGDSMALHSMVVLGAYSPAGEPGFVLLSGKVDPLHGDRANADDLQDVACTVARHAIRSPGAGFMTPLPMWFL